MAIVADLTDRTRVADEVLVHEHDLLAVLMESIPDAIYFKDTASRFVRINKAQARSLGVENPEDAVGKTDFDFFASDHSQDAFEDEQRIVNTMEPVVSKRERIRMPDGQFRWVTATKVPMVNRHGGVTGIAGISRDITDVVHAEEQLKRFATKLQQSNRELQDFASVASHDLQEPLRKIQAFGDRLKSKCGAALGEEGADYLDRMQKAASRMQVLINDLLTFSRIATKAQPFARVDLNQVVAEVLSDLEIRVEENRAQVEVCRLPTIDADSLQMRQLLQNLISNALKFHRKDQPPRIKIDCRVPPSKSAGSKEEVLCEISVEDNGIGFERRYVDRIFNVFQRLHGRGVYEGTGIGLAVCRKIVERHGGHITANSKPGVGSTFIVRLPIKHQPEEGNESEQTW
jgi:PAS domain S-box-containing protein